MLTVATATLKIAKKNQLASEKRESLIMIQNPPVREAAGKQPRADKTNS
jgi:hypothetical protein